MQPAAERTHPRRHRATAAWCAALVLGMVGAAYAAVPLYRLFCDVTGYAGTPRRAAEPSTVVLGRSVTVRFDANVAPSLAWRFAPVQSTLQVKIGENALVFYRATNLSDRALVGTATFNVFPEQAAAYFNKLECFCFKEQRLEPGQSAEFPVSFFVDPAIADDKDARATTHLALSYTFHPVAAPATPGLAQTPPEAGAAPRAVERDGRSG
jgi:cytochrome c oxidase assembly protein subunit 11